MKLHVLGEFCGGSLHAALSGLRDEDSLQGVFPLLKKVTSPQKEQAHGEQRECHFHPHVTTLKGILSP